MGDNTGYILHRTFTLHIQTVCPAHPTIPPSHVRQPFQRLVIRAQILLQVRYQIMMQLRRAKPRLERLDQRRDLAQFDLQQARLQDELVPLVELIRTQTETHAVRWPPLEARGRSKRRARRVEPAVRRRAGTASLHASRWREEVEPAEKSEAGVRVSTADTLRWAQSSSRGIGRVAPRLEGFTAVAEERLEYLQDMREKRGKGQDESDVVATGAGRAVKGAGAECNDSLDRR